MACCCLHVFTKFMAHSSRRPTATVLGGLETQSRERMKMGENLGLEEVWQIERVGVRLGGRQKTEKVSQNLERNPSFPKSDFRQVFPN